VSIAAPAVADELIDLGVAAGLLLRTDDGITVNEVWFSDPASHLRSVLTDRKQREALLGLARRALGTASAADLDLRGLPVDESWLPIAALTNPSRGLYLVIRERADDDVLLSLAARIASNADGLESAATVALPLMRTRPGAAAEFVTGSPDGAVRVGASVTGTDGLLDADAPIGLLGVSIDVVIATDGAAPTLALALKGLRVGDKAPRDVSITDPNQLGKEVMELLAGLVTARARSAGGAIRYVLAMLGIAGPAELPDLPLDDVLARGLPALSDWARTVAASPSAARAWWAELSGLLSDGLVGGTGGDDDPLVFTMPTAAAGLDARVLLRVGTHPGTAGPVLRPAIALTLDAPSGSTVDGGIEIDAELAAITLGARVGAIALPKLTAALHFGSGTAPLITGVMPGTGTLLEIHTARAGLALDANRQLTPLLELDVSVGSPEHVVLDLSSADAIIETIQGALDGIIAALLDTLTSVPQARALAALVGLVRPAAVATADPWPELVSVPHLFAEPGAQVAAYHARVLSSPGGWRALADEVAALLRSAGVTAAQSDGDGTAEIPWRTMLFDGADGQVAFHTWIASDAGRDVLHFAAAINPTPATIGTKQLGLSLSSELLRISFPSQSGGSVAVEIAPSHTVSAQLGSALELSLPSSPVTLLTEAIRVGVRWSRAAGLQGAFAVDQPRLRVATETTELPAVDKPFDGGLPTFDADDVPWTALEMLAGSALDAMGPWPASLSAFAGWTAAPSAINIELPLMAGVTIAVPDGALPRLSLQALTVNPVEALREWIANVAIRAADESTPAAHAVMAWLSQVLTGATPDLATLHVPEGAGTAEQPWAIPMSGAAELLVWIGPDGPSTVTLDGFLPAMVPAELQTAAGGGAALAFDSQFDLLKRAAVHVPDLAHILAGRDEFADAVQTLVMLLQGSDGLISNIAAQPPQGWTSGVMPAVAHLQLPAYFDAAQHIPGLAADAARQVFLIAPLSGVAPWPGQKDAPADAHIDLSTEGLAPEAFDLSALAAAGPYFISMPTLAAAGSFDGIVARLGRTLDAIRDQHGGQPLSLVAHSIAGLAARAVAAEPGLSHVITFGTPHGGAAFGWLDRLDTADALRAVQALKSFAGPDATALDDFLVTIGHALDGDPHNDARPKPLPQADFAAAPAPAPASSVVAHAWSSQLDADTLSLGLAQLTQHVLFGALSRMPGQADSLPPRYVSAAVRTRPGLTAPAPGGVDVAADMRMHLGTIPVDPDVEPEPAMAEVRIGLSRPGGWLVGTPSSEHPTEQPREPRARTAELRLTAALNPSRARAAIFVHEGSALGVARREWVVDETVIGPPGGDAFSFGPEARVLLGEIMQAVGPVTSGTSADALARLLAAVGVADPPNGSGITLRTEALERLLADPLGELGARLREDRDAVLDTLSPFAPGDAIQLGLTLDDTPSLRITTTGDGLTLAGGRLHLTGALSRSVTGVLHAQATLGSDGSRLELSTDAGMRLRVTAGSDYEPVDLWPVPDLSRLPREAPVLLIGEVVRIALGWADAAAPAVVGPLIDALGLRHNPAALVRGRSTLLAALPPRTDGLRGLSVAAVRQLFDAARALVGPSTADAALPLPWGLRLTVPDSALDPVLALGWAAPAAGAGATLTGMLRLRLGPDFAVTPAAKAGVQIDGLTGLDQVAFDIGYDAGATAAVRLRRGGSDPDITIEFLPTCPGLGALADLVTGAAVDALLPIALDTLGDHAVVGPPLLAAGDALGLRPGGTGFSAAELRNLSADPPNELSTRLSANPGALLDAAAQLASNVVPAGMLSHGERPSSTTHFLQVQLTPAVSVAVDTAPAGRPTLTVSVTDAHPIPELVVNAGVSLSTGGIGPINASAGITDPALLQLGSASVLPFVSVGTDAVELGAWTAAPTSTDRQAVVARFTAGGVTLLRRTATGPDDGNLGSIMTDAVRMWLAPLALDVVLEAAAVRQRLAQQFSFAGTSIGELLTDAELLITTPTGFALAPGAFDAEHIGARVFALGAHVTDKLKASLPSPHALAPLTVGLASADHDGRTVYGMTFGLSAPLTLFTTGGVELRIEAVDAPGLLATGARPGVDVLAVSLPSGPIDAGDARFTPWLRVNGVGLRALGTEGSKLIDLVASVDAVALHAVLEHNAADDGPTRAGARLLLANLGVPLGAAGGGNAVAAKLLSGDDGNTQGDEAKLRPAFSPALQIVRVPPADTTMRFSGGEGDGPWWLAVQRHFGPLYVEQIGLDSEELPNGDVDRVKFLLDGGVAVAGLTVQVDDLSVSVPYHAPLDLGAWRLDLAGLGVGYAGGGVTIAGGLRRRPPRPGSQASPDYVGMLVVRGAGYGLDAVGAYSELPIAGQPGQTYTSMFVFAALSATLGGPPAFFVTGIGAGGGLNRRLVVPSDINALPSFPLVAAMNPDSTFAQDPMGALEAIGSAFPPQRGTFWLAAGVRFTTFVFIESIAVLSVEVGDSVELNLLGLSRMSLPRRDLTLAQLELALRARFSSRDMVVSVQGQLTDNSWLLSESCRLTGGFALVNWLRTGQFVLTVGGYHPEFDKPPEFPVVPRVGFSWAVSRAVAIKGEAYFALTASCVMAGGRLEVSYDTSSVWASLTAIFNAIVSWDPFFYDVSVYVRVSAGVDISIWTPFGRAHVSFSTSIGAGVHVWGPDLRGEAELDLDVISVTVGFGADGDTTSNDPIGWNEFHEKYLVAGDPTGETMNAGVVAGLLAIDAGSTSPGDGTAASPWRVTPEFLLRSETRTASNVVNGHGLATVTTQRLDLGPMKTVDVTSIHTVEVFSPVGEVTAQLDVSPVAGPVPEAVWTVLGDNPAPAAKIRQAYVGATVAAPARITAPQGTVKLTQFDPGPLRPLPFLDEIADRPDFAGDVAAADRYIAAQPKESAAILQAAAGRLTRGDRPTDPFAFRTFVVDRVAPPRLAPLGEGMVDNVKPAVATAPVPAPPQPAPDPVPGPLQLHAVLRAPTAKVARGAMRTTVGPTHDRLPRSAPPTLASARTVAAAFGPARLELRGAPLVESAATVMAADGGAASSAAGGGNELRAGLLASREVADQFEKFGKALHTNAGAPLMPGDVQVWERSAADFDAADLRPVIVVEGDQLVRLVALDRADVPLADTFGMRHTFPLPHGTARLAIAGLGAAGRFGRRPAGAAGWHAATTLLQIGEAAYLGPRCVVTAASPATLRRRQSVTTSVVAAATAVAGASAVTTRLPAGTRTLIIALETASDPDEALAALVLGIDGAQRTTSPPAVVVSGTRAHGLFTVTPVGRGSAITVTVAADSRWRLAAVAGMQTDAATVTPLIVERGLEEIIGTEQVSVTGSSTVSYKEGR
jgi:hypothetical protein